jgi:hypothetical protein
MCSARGRADGRAARPGNYLEDFDGEVGESTEQHGEDRLGARRPGSLAGRRRNVLPVGRGRLIQQIDIMIIQDGVKRFQCAALSGGRRASGSFRQSDRHGLSFQSS